MRQFILAGSVAYTAAASILAVANGAVGFFWNDNGVPKVTATGEELTEESMLVLGRPATAGGPVVLPIYKNNFSYVKGVYQAGSKFKATFVVPVPAAAGEYSLIVTKKGLGFNRKNNFTANVYVPEVGMTAAQLATAIAKQVNNNSAISGIKATVSTATITFDGDNVGDDFKITGADRLSSVNATVTTPGAPAYGDAAYVVDLANKAAADAGFNYTYQGEAVALYPNYPLNPLAQPNAADAGFTIFTMRFAEPRQVKTRDEVVHQIVQVAFPTGAAAIATFETVLKELANVPDPVGG